ncbi:Polyphosphoinositide phosphatase [Ceratocystis lukuohia]|uniref:Polyphosphoinositide phosphatase n=1 Tax=Ceratocystis lukuohia TaxID=2019550 RepID=A0ABR4MBM7_9PEZI
MPPEDNAAQTPKLSLPISTVGPSPEDIDSCVWSDSQDDAISSASMQTPLGGSQTKGSQSFNFHKFGLYETASRFYVVGSDVTENHHRILKIERTSEDSELSIADDKTVYTRNGMNELLEAIEDGNRATGGIKLRSTIWGLLGFIRFTGPYYLVVITKKSTVALIGGHHIYQIEGTEIIPLTRCKNKQDHRNAEESRFLNIFTSLDLTRTFYYSPSYDISHTLQHNLSRERERLTTQLSEPGNNGFNGMFVWNSHLVKPIESCIENPYVWCRAIIHGYIEQSALNVFGRILHITLIGRRSRHYAGVRFLKRGVTEKGHVANEVETEQIVSEALTTSFHSPGPELYSNPHFTSYVQHRGSIPLSWTQDASGVSPKPPIELQVSDPFYSGAAAHFDNLFGRYGTPVYVLNLVKARERIPRESKLLDHYIQATSYLNQYLPDDAKIIHTAWDMSRASKSRDQDVISTLESIAEDTILKTGFFHNGSASSSVTPPRVQNGVVRTNCIDCLDRTNAAQFVIGKRALGHQLHALGVLPDTTMDYDTDAINMLTNLYHDHGDTIALQYAGSQLVNTVETYRKTGSWTSNPRDMLESFKRFYNNSFLDTQRQQTYNLFLGNYVYEPGKSFLWDMHGDYQLHNPRPAKNEELATKDYMNWFNPQHLQPRQIPLDYRSTRPSRERCSIDHADNYWVEYYRPLTLSTFNNMFAFRMKSTLKEGQATSRPSESLVDMSPFRVRIGPEANAPLKRHPEKSFSENNLKDEDTDGTSTRGSSLQQWFHTTNSQIMQNPAPTPTSSKPGPTTSNTNATPVSGTRPQKLTPHEKFESAQSIFAKAVHESLDPNVTVEEKEDYFHYLSHPHSLPLVVSAETPADVEPEYIKFVHGLWQSEGLEPSGTEDLQAYIETMEIGDDPLNVTENDSQKKRYKAYRKWLQGKSFFKQHPAVAWQVLE